MQSCHTILLLWNSYTVLIHSLSNSYACGSRYRPKMNGAFLRCFDAGQSSGSLSGICWQVQNYARSIPMMDVVMVALAVGFFAVSIAYVYACEQL